MNTGNIIKRYPPSREYILLILHELQNNNARNYLSYEDLKLTAEYLNISYSSVYGVASYYTMFSLKPRGRHVIRVCQSPVCEMIDSKSLTLAMQDMLGIEVGETTADGLFTLEQTQCLGQCDNSPVMMVDTEIYTRVSSKKGKDIIDKLRKESIATDVSNG
jgi:NADH-quinone oxidoreductase subunit E